MFCSPLQIAATRPQPSRPRRPTAQQPGPLATSPPLVRCPARLGQRFKEPSASAIFLGAPTSLTLYIQSSSATDSFYIGDVTISELAPPPLSPSQQDNTGIATTFEDGGLDGWSSRSGASTVANSTAASHSGTHSLLTTGRIGKLGRAADQCQQQDVSGLAIQHQRMGFADAGGWIEPRDQHEPADHAQRQHQLSRA